MPLINRFKKASLASGFGLIPLFIGFAAVVILITALLLVRSFPPAVEMMTSEATAPAKDKADAVNTYRAGRSAQWGQLGDMLGGIFNPILAFISTIGVLVTVLVSLRQLRFARHAMLLENNRTRKEARRSQEAALASDSLSALTALLEHARSMTAYGISQKQAGYDIAALQDDEAELADLLERSFISARTKLHGEAYLPERMEARNRRRNSDDAYR